MLKKSYTNLLLTIVIALFWSGSLRAQQTTVAENALAPGSTAEKAQLTPAGNLLLLQETSIKHLSAKDSSDTAVDKRLNKNRHKALPDHLTLQFAGSIGLLSGGLGYRNPKGTLESELLFGYLPASIGGDHLITTALKANWMPFLLFKDKKVQLYPLQTGVMAAYTFGSQFFGFQPDHYPKGYYPFSTAFHAYWQIGSRVSVPVKTNRLEFYYELNASAEELVTLVQNPDFIGPGKIFTLALGLKLNFEP